MPDEPAVSVTEVFERALGNVLARVFLYYGADAEGGAEPNRRRLAAPIRIAVAYSGGLDSSALLHLMHRAASRHPIELHAFHIHHGISPNADEWLAHCRNECERLGVAFEASHVRLDGAVTRGIEEAARTRRYAALGSLCRKHAVRVLLTAHHQDDQAETVLLQLLRGSGIAGLRGMEALNRAPGLLGDPDLQMARPLLDASRMALAHFVQAELIGHIEDESNIDPRYARNALRREVVPAISRVFPGFQQRVARAARHAQAGQRLLDQLAAQDLAQCAEESGIVLERLKQFDADRIDNVLRYWLGVHGVRMPATAWLAEMRMQLFDAREDARVCVVHADCEIRRHRGRVFMTPRAEEHASSAAKTEFRWEGQAEMRFDGFLGSLHFETAGNGIDRQWLLAEDLVMRYREGGERLKAAVNRPTRSLKHHYQALGIPSWERERLPLVMTSGGQLVYAAGIGMNIFGQRDAHADAVELRWVSDDASE